MDITNWYRSFSRRRRSVRLGNHYDVDDDEPQEDRLRVDENVEVPKVSTAKTGSRRPPIWKVIWKKLSEEKKGKNNKKKSRLEFSRSVHVQVPRYDEHTYSQNFDNGSNWDEPEQLFKSFSVRYSDPSNKFLK